MCGVDYWVVCFWLSLGEYGYVSLYEPKYYVSKFWGGGCREFVSCEGLLWENWFHSHCSHSVVMVAMWFPLWSYMLASESCIWMVGWFTWMSLSGLHSCVDSLRLVNSKGGCINLVSFDWLWLRQLAYFWVVFCSIWLLWYCVMHSILCSSSMLFGCSNSSSVHHCCVVPCGSCH